MMDQSLGNRGSTRGNIGRRVLFRLLAVMMGVMPFALAEVTLRALDLGHPAHFEDPLVGFSAIRPLFVLDRTRERFEIPVSRQKTFRPESFAARKPADEFRIFVLGGSTVQGRPFAIETSFSTWLELSLQAAEPSRRWEVINCGGVSYASYRLVPILREVLQYQPDLIIVYTGQNEFLEDRTYGSLKRMPRFVKRAEAIAGELRLFTLLREGWARLTGGDRGDPMSTRPILPAEVDALLDYRGGLEAYHRDDDWRRNVIEHYERNLRLMIALCQSRDVPIVLVNPVCNLETPPFKVEPGSRLSKRQREAIDSLRSAAGRAYHGQLPLAAELLRRAIAIDDRDAGLHFALATVEQRLGHNQAARHEFLRARDEDICPLRLLEPMHRVILDVARDTGTPVVDADRLFASQSPGGIPGRAWLIDHVHPSIQGHKLLAAALLRSLANMEPVQPTPGWRERRELLYTQHTASLGDFYYVKGEQRLRNLEAWAHGRGNRIRSDLSSAPERPTGDRHSGGAPRHQSASIIRPPAAQR